MSSSSPSFQTECHFHSVGLGFGWGRLFGLFVVFFFFLSKSSVAKKFSKISPGSLKTKTGTLHATEGSKDIRSMSRETLEKQLIPLKPKKLLAIFS